MMAYPPPVTQRTTLHGIVARFHFWITLLAVTLAWLAILFAGVMALKSYARQNLEMAAQLASYGAEPGLVFRDAEAARDGVKPLIEKDGIARLRISGVDGSVLIDQHSPKADPAPFMTRTLMAQPVTTPIFHDGMEVGQVQVWGDSSAIISFARLGMMTGIGCLAFTIIGTMILRRRLEKDLVTPLSAMTEIVHDVRLHRRFDQRVQSVGVRELDRLGSDINSLLKELQGWQGHVENERAILTHRAMHDALTSLPNRAAFDEQLLLQIADAHKRDCGFALVFLDADNFKQVNDGHGHAAGDQVLIALAERIRGALRKDDFAARLGGDEFAIIFDPVGDASNTEEFVQRLRTSVERPIALADGRTYEMLISIGISNFPEDGASATELLTAADAAMYADKLKRRTI